MEITEERAIRSDGRNFPARWLPTEQREALIARVLELRAEGLQIRQIQARLQAEGIRRSFGWVQGICAGR